MVPSSQGKDGDYLEGCEQEPHESLKEFDSHRNSFMILNTAIMQNSTHSEIENLMTTWHLTSDNYNQHFTDLQQWELINSAVVMRRSDILKALLDRGINPNIKGFKGTWWPEISILQSVVEESSPEMLRLLCSYNVNANNVSKHDHPLGFEHISDCKSIMCCVFQKDDPDMMKLLIKDYNVIHNWDGTCALYMACKLGAYKCAQLLLEDSDYREHVNLSEVSLYETMINKSQMIPLLYEAGVKEGLYTPNDLGFCLYEIIRDRDYKNQALDLADDINMLLSLGAPVDYDAGFLNKKTVLDVLLKPMYIFTSQHAMKVMVRAVSLLLMHGAKAKFSIVNEYLYSMYIRVIQIHKYEDVEATSNIATLFVNMMHALYNKEFSEQIEGPSTITTVHHGLALPSDSNMFASILQKHTDQPQCILIKQAIRFAVLNIDWPIQYSSVFFVENLMQECSCLSYLVRFWLPVWPHTEYQQFLKEVHNMKEQEEQEQEGGSETQHDELSWDIPYLRSLKELTRVALFSSLCLPRTVAVEGILLPNALKQYVCLASPFEATET